MDGKTAMRILNELYWKARNSQEPLGNLCFHMHPQTQRELELQYILINNSSPRSGLNDFMGIPFHVSEDVEIKSILLAPIDEESTDHLASGQSKKNDRI